MTYASMLRTSILFGLGLVPAIAAPGQEEARRPVPPRSFLLGEMNPKQQEETARRLYRQFGRNFRVEPDGGFQYFAPEQFGQFRLELDSGERVLGLTVRPAPEVLRAHLDLPEGAGLVVSEVDEDGPTAGKVEPNDILVSVGETELAEPTDLAEAVEAAEGETIALTLLRKGERQTVEIERPEPEGDAPEGERFLLGVSIETPDEAVRSQLDLPEGEGVIVMEVAPDSPAARAGVQPNDILTRLGDEPIVGAQELAEQVQENGAEPVELTLLRDGEETTVEVTPEKRPAPPIATDAPRTAREALRFFGPGVMIDPETGQVRPGPGPGGPGGPGMQGLPRNFLIPVPDGPGLEQKLDEILEQLRQLREEVDALKQDRPGRRDRGDQRG